MPQAPLGGEDAPGVRTYLLLNRLIPNSAYTFRTLREGILVIRSPLGGLHRSPGGPRPSCGRSQCTGYTITIQPIVTNEVSLERDRPGDVHESHEEERGIKFDPSPTSHSACFDSRHTAIAEGRTPLCVGVVILFSKQCRCG